MGTPTYLVAAGLALVIFASGYWLARFRFPYPTALLTVHKLLGLALLVLLDVTVYRAWPLILPALVTVIIANLALLALLVTGGVLSAKKQVPGVVKLVHKAAPWVAVAALALLYPAW